MRGKRVVSSEITDFGKSCVHLCVFVCVCVCVCVDVVIAMIKSDCLRINRCWLLSLLLCQCHFFRLSFGSTSNSTLLLQRSADNNSSSSSSSSNIPVGTVISRARKTLKHHEDSEARKSSRRHEDTDFSLLLRKKSTKAGGIMWEDLMATSSSSSSRNNGGSTQIILNKSSGYVQNGHICGILGPSGVGKSTFLAAMVNGRTGTSLQVSGSVLHHFVESQYNNDTDNGATSSLSSLHSYCSPISQNQAAFLQQHDAFFERLTVRETLDLAVFLEWPKASSSVRESISLQCLESLGLSGVKDRQVGSPKKSRTSIGATLSGGEMRRLSVALELVTMPSIFMADEPTTGLDATMSQTVMGAITNLVKANPLLLYVAST